MIEQIVRPSGRWALDWYDYGLALGRHLVRAIVTVGRPQGRDVVRRTTLYQIYFTGVDAVPVVSALAMLLGGLIIVQALTLLTGTGNEDFLGTLMELVVVRELGPVMTALIVIGRSGSSITVELGNMRVGKELDLLDGMGIDTDRFLVLPRMIGVVAAMFGLVLIFDLVAVLGGFAVGRMFAIDIPLLPFLEIVGSHLSLNDLWVSSVKSLAFGVVIATVSTWQGMAVQGAVTEVPQATRRSVVHSLVLCIALNALVSIAVYAGGV